MAPAWRATARWAGHTPRCGRLAGTSETPPAARLSPVRRFLALVLIALLPLQFSWAAAASYCEHETAETGHFGHHDHPQHAGLDGGYGPLVDRDASPDAAGDPASGAVGADCGHCHGYCSVMLPVQPALPEAPTMAHPGAAAHESGDADAPARPERPQWPPLA